MRPISIRICVQYLVTVRRSCREKKGVDPIDTLTAGMNGYRITSMAAAPPSGYLSRNPHCFKTDMPGNLFKQKVLICCTSVVYTVRTLSNYNRANDVAECVTTDS